MTRRARALAWLRLSWRWKVWRLAERRYCRADVFSWAQAHDRNAPSYGDPFAWRLRDLQRRSECAEEAVEERCGVCWCGAAGPGVAS